MTSTRFRVRQSVLELRHDILAGLQRARGAHRQVLAWIAQRGLKAMVKKCDFFHGQVALLGRAVDKDVFCIDQMKVKVIQDILRPACMSELGSFLGISGY